MNSRSLGLFAAIGVASATVGSGVHAASYSFAANFKTTDLQCGYFVNTVTCAAAAVVGRIEDARAGDTFSLSASFDERIRVGGSKTSNIAFIALADATLVLGQGAGTGPYLSRYVTQFQGFEGHLPPFRGPLTLASGSGYFGIGGYAGGYGVPNTGFSFTGMSGQLTALTDAPRPIGGLVVGYSYVVPNAPEEVAGVQGGSVDSPVVLPPGQVGKVTANIGGEFDADQYYGFRWNRGGLFQTTAEVLNADPSAVYSLRLLDSGRNLLHQLELNAGNGFRDTLKVGRLKIGDYVIGISLLNGASASALTFQRADFSLQSTTDAAQFALSFDTPVGSVPEPASWALMIGGFGLVGTAARRRQRGQASYA